MVTPAISKKSSPETVANVTRYLMNERAGTKVPARFQGEGVQSDLIRNLIKVQHIDHGRLTCILTVKPYVCNLYNSLHGGAVGSIAEFIAIACAKTVVNKNDKELFLGDLNICYLAPAVNQAKVIVDASVVRSGRNLIVVAIEFKLKDSEKLTYLARATFYNTPVASL